ncbi:LOW QUALITY PROTEIN: protein SCAR [Impatiens glandulifera]|uniref:LOW QUALITY PROTEIN: protein SCAR n=1 Tax=Impatiens glandulifera TaxID=253017 RepID=UPI001FB0AF4C|nr:LOW QUALITY PROTEIN: protein SCAR [Impatiens glandulifera]
MKAQQQQSKLKTAPRPLFSCGLFRHCARTVLSPTTPSSPSRPLTHFTPPPQQQPHSSNHLLPPPPPPPPQSESESSSSSNTSQSFTQWRFPLTNSPVSSIPQPPSPPPPPIPLPEPIPLTDLKELFYVVEIQLSSGSESDRFKAIHMLERSLVPNPPAVADDDAHSACPVAVMVAVLDSLKDTHTPAAKSATKVLLALCLAEGNRSVAVESGAAASIIESLSAMEIPAAERALAALELLCTVAEGAAEVRAHALAVPIMVDVMGKITTARGKEYAISVLAVIFCANDGGGGGGDEPAEAPEWVAKAVELALQSGDCTARGRRKGAQLLKTLEEIGRPDLVVQVEQ